MRWRAVGPGRIPPALVALVAYAVLAVGWFHTTWRAPASRFIGSGPDPASYAWYLVWTPFALRHGLNPLLTDYMNYPAGVNLMWNVTMRLLELGAWPLTATAGPVVAYNVLLTLGLVLSAWVARTVFRRYVDGDLPAFIGGLLYGFSPYMVGHAGGHLDLMWAVIPPLLLPVLEEVLVRQRRRAISSGAMLGLLASAQLLLNGEMLVTEGVAAAVGTAVLAALYPAAVRERRSHAVRTLGAALAVFLLLCAWPLATALFGPQAIRGIVHRSTLYVTDVANLVVPTSLHLFRPALSDLLPPHFGGNLAEATGYLGLPLLVALVATTIRLPREPIVGVAATAALALVMLSFGPRALVLTHAIPVPLPWALVHHVPVLQNVIPGRLTLHVFLLAGLLVAIGLDRVPKPMPRAVVLAVAIVIATLCPRLPYERDVEVPAFFRGEAVRRIPDGAVALVAPYVDGTDRSDPILWQATSNMRFRVADGYFFAPGRNGRIRRGPIPACIWRVMKDIGAGREAPTLTPALRAELLADLHARDVRVALVGPMANQAAMVEFLRATLGHDPDVVDGVYVWWDVRS